MADNSDSHNPRNGDLNMTWRLVILGGFAVFCSSLTLHPSSLTKGQEPKAKTMTVRWYGQSFFQVEDSTGRKFAFDPHAIPAFGRQMAKADFVIVTHPHDDHSLIEMIDTGKVNDKKDPVRIAEADVYRGVTETKTGKQDWKTIDEKRGNIRIRNVATLPRPPTTASRVARTASSSWKSMV